MTDSVSLTIAPPAPVGSEPNQPARAPVLAELPSFSRAVQPEWQRTADEASDARVQALERRMRVDAQWNLHFHISFSDTCGIALQKGLWFTACGILWGRDGVHRLAMLAETHWAAGLYGRFLLIALACRMMALFDIIQYALIGSLLIAPVAVLFVLACITMIVLIFIPPCAVPFGSKTNCFGCGMDWPSAIKSGVIEFAGKCFWSIPLHLVQIALFPVELISPWLVLEVLGLRSCGYSLPDPPAR